MSEKQEADTLAKSFLKDYPQCFRMLGPDVVTLMVQGYVLRHVVDALTAGKTHYKSDAYIIQRLVSDVFNAANHLSALHL
jgi:hypothetical protein